VKNAPGANSSFVFSVLWRVWTSQVHNV